jgi:hypothetical protein
MISIITPSDLRLFISGDWITVAKGNNRTIIFNSNLSNQCPNPNYDPVQWLDPPTNSIPNPTYDPIQFFTGIVTQPSNLVINGASDINATTYNAIASRSCDGITDSQLYNYEVISPKVVYQRVENSTQVVFIDVTRKQNYSHFHNIVTTNTEWMQNPSLNRGRILIQKADEFGVFAPAVNDVFPDIIGSMGVDSQVVLNGLPETTCLYRAIYEIRLIPNCGGTSPLIFQAIGDEFEFRSYYYNFPNPSVISTEFNLNKLLQDTDSSNIDYFTTEINQLFTINFDSSNITYKYEYVNSTSTALPSNLQYFSSDKKIEGSVTNIYPYTINTITFNGTENQFIDGQLVNTANPFVETKTNYLEAVRSNINSTTQRTCSYIVDVIDNTLLSNPYYVTRGVAQYEIFNEETKQYELLTNVQRLQTYTTERCDVGKYKIRNRFVIRAIPNCGGTSPVVFETNWYNYVITVVEVKPELSLPELDCCYEISKPITVYPDIIKLNSNLCPLVAITNSNTIIYTLSAYNSTTKQYDFVSTTTLPVVSPETNSLYSFTFTPSLLGRYKLEARLTNCCESITRELYYDICDSVTVKQKDCANWIITNKSFTTNYSVIVRNVLTNQIVTQTAVNTNSEFKYKFDKDGIYTIEVNNRLYVAYIYCVIEECYIKSIKDILCREKNCKDCLNTEDVKRQAELNEFRALYQVWMKSIEEDYRLKISYTQVDINNKLVEFQQNNMIYNKLLQYCDSCIKQLTDCGCK